MAGETGTSGTSESEFPVFKSSEGAFDRAKYEEQLSGVVKNGQLTGKNIDEDLIKQKESADEVVRKAFKFYDESFNKSIKEIDPSIDIKSIYYQEAYSDGGSHTGKIRRKIEKGEALDGKEIFEMAKGNAKNKIANMTFLKNGRVTDIVENLGLKEIKEFDLFEDVKSDFNSKIKDENLKFEPLLENFSKVLHNFREIKIPTKEIYSTYYSPENMAIISALGKVLEAEGFTNENVTQMSKAYDENIKKLIETKGGKKAEDVIKEAAQEAKKEETATKTEEQKLEEKKVEEPKKEPTAENKDIKLDQPKEATNTSSTTTEEPKKAEEKKEPEVKTADQKLEEKKPEEKKGSKEKNEKIEEKGKNKQPTFSDPVKGVLDMLGIKSPDSKKEEGNKGDKDKGDKDKGDKDKGDKGKGDKGKDKDKNITTGSTKVDKLLEEIGFSNPNKKESEGDKEKNNKSKTEKEETKLEEKVSGNKDKKTETPSGSMSIKETETQNLSSVITTDNPQKNDNKEDDKKPTNKENNINDKKTEEINPVKTTLEEQKESENKTKKDDQDKINKDISDNMKSMVALLTQLNNTLKNPLMVIPNDKKFH